MSETLLNPNIVFLLFFVGMVGIYVEVVHPGLIVPGAIGVVALIAFFWNASSLSPNWSGLIYMILAFLLLIIEVFVTTYGIVTLGAVVSLIVGAFLFFSGGGPEQREPINPFVVYSAGTLVGGLGVYVLLVVVRLRRMPINTGPEGMIGETVIALTELTPEGRVSYGGEDWAARLNTPTPNVGVGAELKIVSLQGLCLHVQLVQRPLPLADLEPGEEA